MNESLNVDDRRQVRTTLVASLALVFTFALGGVAWAGTAAPAARGAGLRAASAPAAATAPAFSSEQQNAMVGCGCAEACLAAE